MEGDGRRGDLGERREKCIRAIGRPITTVVSQKVEGLTGTINTFRIDWVYFRVVNNLRTLPGPRNISSVIN